MACADWSTSQCTWLAGPRLDEYSRQRPSMGWQARSTCGCWSGHPLAPRLLFTATPGPTSPLALLVWPRPCTHVTLTTSYSNNRRLHHNFITLDFHGAKIVVNAWWEISGVLQINKSISNRSNFIVIMPKFELTCKTASSLPCNWCIPNSKITADAIWWYYDGRIGRVNTFRVRRLMYADMTVMQCSFLTTMVWMMGRTKMHPSSAIVCSVLPQSGRGPWRASHVTSQTSL